MRAAFYVPQTRHQVDAFRLHLTKLGAVCDNRTILDIERIAVAYLGARVIRLPNLTDEKALQHLEDTFDIDASGDASDDAPLAGALYYAAETGSVWIYVEETDIPTRQRFSIAHEVGHFVNEIVPLLSRKGTHSDTEQPVLRFSRCSSVSLDSIGKPTKAEEEKAIVTRRWSAADLREINANRFAAEILMPYQGLRALIAANVGISGVRTQRELDHLIGVVASTYCVSRACAERRILKDLRIEVTNPDATLDFFA